MKPLYITIVEDVSNGNSWHVLEVILNDILSKEETHHLCIDLVKELVKVTH